MCRTGHSSKQTMHWPRWLDVGAKTPMRKLLYALSHNKARFVYILLLGLVLNAIFAAADPLIMKLLIDEGLIKQNFKLFAIFATVVVLFGTGMRGLFLVYELLA